MGINRRFIGARERLSRELAAKTDFLGSTIPLINQGKVIPIISNSFRIEQIFQEEREITERIEDVQQHSNNDLTIEEQLTKEWAESEEVEYPMPDKYNLARIAQYHLVETKDNFQARADYINFLKKFLLAMTQDDKEYGDLVDTLNKQVNELHFSEIVRQLDYPRFSQGIEDPLRLLARLPLPIYITTSYYDFLERALEAEGKKPVMQVCFWSGGRAGAKTEHLADPEFLPSPTSPAVYHLFGLEDYPQTLVLSEDDYMNFLISVVEDTNTQNPIVSLKLREALADLRLLLLGYQLRDWDFRVLFKFIAKFRNEALSPRGMVIQLKPDRKRIGDEEKARKYLSDYFDRKSFHFEWTDTESFMQRLWDEWNKYRRDQA